ncbi:hypothetical protein [Nostoc sp. FACHB-145]|uniref:hypothetical protein n=1 Tax=Nostoc sp. FACHB-145 TaxID=2692836 RepID=UPI0016845165|nr:hypothetical protein [Nostoc sp. FACHB-145]MBD2472388.1 hypothetical protein [Nostoc sp. FACHB-145]
MLTKKLNRFNFLDIEDFIDFTVEYNCKILGRNLQKTSYKSGNSTLNLEYEDNLYFIKVEFSNSGRYYTASATRKDIKYREGLPYHRKFKGEIYIKKWHEIEEGFIEDLTKVIYSIFSIDEKCKTIGMVSKIYLDRGYGFIETYNCNYIIFYFSDIPDHLRQSVQPGSILRFYQSTEYVRFKRLQYLKAINFDDYIQHNTEIPLDELPGCVSNLEHRSLIIKNAQTQFDGTEIIAPVLYAFLKDYKKNAEYCGESYIGKWDDKSKFLYLIDKNTNLIKLIAQRRDGFIYKYEWTPVYPKYPFKNISDSDISFFKEMKKLLEKQGINVDKQELF